MPEKTDIIDIIWPIAELLRHDYKRSDYGKVVLPMTVLRRLDCVLEPTKEAVLKKVPDASKKSESAADLLLNRVAEQSFHNRSPFDFHKLLNEPKQIAANLRNYINGFSANIREILEYFSFSDHITRLDHADLLYKVVSHFTPLELRPENVDNHKMGEVYEELIRRFAELSNETAGEHFTPREVIKLMVNILFLEDSDILSKEGIVKTLYDPACGTGGMLSIAEEYLLRLNEQGRLELFGQEVNAESYAICKADMVIKGNNAANIKFGNSFSVDGLPDGRFDYLLSNPPFGVEWKKVEEDVKDEHRKLGYGGRFGAGFPRISDGSLLFLQHMWSKRKTEGTRLAIVFNGSPLFSGGAGSGESEIRRWIIENDWLEAIIAMPDQLFYNTGISTYIWVLTNRKSNERKGKIQLINATGEEFKFKLRKSLGNKRYKIGDGQEGSLDQISPITRLYGTFEASDVCKILDNEDFGYRRVTVERPLRLNFQITPERINAVLKVQMSPEVAQAIEQALTEAMRTKAFDGVVFRSKKLFTEALEEFWEQSGAFKPSIKQLYRIVPLLGAREEEAEECLDADGEKIADPELRDFENVPLKVSVGDYFEREVKPYAADAWINEKVRDERDGEIGKVGYEIPFTRYFYEYEQPITAERIQDLEDEIKALEGQIQGMLRQAVTRGLDSTPLLPSGIQWLGDVPAHWQQRRLKYVVKFFGGGTPSKTNEDYWSGTIPWVSPKDMKRKFIYETEDYISEAAVAESSTQLIEPGAVLIVVRSGILKHSIPVAINTVGVALNQDMKAIIPSDLLCAEYVAYVIDGCQKALLLEWRKTGATVESLEHEFIANTIWPIPPLEEQKAIVEYLDSEMREMEGFIQAFKDQIEKLRDYRQALISAAVTGKVDVKGTAS